MNQAVYAVIGIPFLSAILLAIIPGYKVTAIGNVLASGLTFAASLSFLALPPVIKNYVILDDLNVFFIILNTLVGFTTSVFSGSYIEHEIETGHLTPRFIRFYHAMFQAMMGGMNLALLANNIDRKSVV
jgi:hydrogenase-4 component F